MTAVSMAGGAESRIDVAAGRLLRVLADPTRLAILRRLRTGPATVTDLLAALGDPPRSRIGNHLACLVHCRLVSAQRTGRHVTYTLTERGLLDVVELAGRLARPNAAHLASCTRIGPAWI